MLQCLKLILKDCLSHETECRKMGCVTSKTDINDLHCNIFQVMNVDEMCNPLLPGELEVTGMDLVLHQRGKTPVHWPIKCLRRYGFDAQLFSFECGRRCPTGPGIYAFKCSRAEQLFNLLQAQVQMRNIPGDDTVSNSVDFSPRQTESNYLEPAPVQFRQNGNRFSLHNGRLGSVGSSSNGPLSPLTTSPSPPPPPPPSNNNCISEESKEEKHRKLSQSYSNSTAISDLCSPPTTEPPPPPLVLTMYTNIATTPTSPSAFSDVLQMDDASDGNELSDETFLSPVYMNVIPGQEIVLPMVVPSELPSKSLSDLDPIEERHCYANLDLGEMGKTVQLPTGLQPSTPPPQTINYILLDLEQASSSSPVAGPSGQLHSPVTLTATTSLPESPNRPTEGYATIDFNKTVALCAMSCPAVDDEGSRKTRHNSTIEATLAVVEEKLVRRSRHSSTISELMAPLAARISSTLRAARHVQRITALISASPFVLMSTRKKIEKGPGTG